MHFLWFIRRKKGAGNSRLCFINIQSVLCWVKMYLHKILMRGMKRKKSFCDTSESHQFLYFKMCPAQVLHLNKRFWITFILHFMTESSFNLKYKIKNFMKWLKSLTIFQQLSFLIIHYREKLMACGWTNLKRKCIWSLN